MSGLLTVCCQLPHMILLPSCSVVRRNQRRRRGEWRLTPRHRRRPEAKRRAGVYAQLGAGSTQLRDDLDLAQGRTLQTESTLGDGDKSRAKRGPFASEAPTASPSRAPGATPRRQTLAEGPLRPLAPPHDRRHQDTVTDAISAPPGPDRLSSRTMTDTTRPGPSPCRLPSPRHRLRFARPQAPREGRAEETPKQAHVGASPSHQSSRGAPA